MGDGVVVLACVDVELIAVLGLAMEWKAPGKMNHKNEKRNHDTYCSGLSAVDTKLLLGGGKVSMKKSIPFTFALRLFAFLRDMYFLKWASSHFHSSPSFARKSST